MKATDQNAVHTGICKFNAFLAKYLKEKQKEENEEEFDSESERVHMILEIMIANFKISDTLNKKLKSEFNVYGFDFFNRNSYRK